MKLIYAALVLVASTLLLGCITPPFGDSCAAWRECRQNADRCLNIQCGPGGQMEKNCDAQYPFCATPTSTLTPPYPCQWCGFQCVRASPDLRCPTFASPADKQCVESYGSCVIINRATPTPYATVSPTPTEYPPYPRS